MRVFADREKKNVRLLCTANRRPLSEVNVRFFPWCNSYLAQVFKFKSINGRFRLNDQLIGSDRRPFVARPLSARPHPVTWPASELGFSPK